MDLALAKEITGGLMDASKMPGLGYGTPAENCNVGSKLRNVPNSVCSKCYALKGFFVYQNAKNALKRRFNKIDNAQWVEAMVFLINYYEKSGFFRWNVSGDIWSEYFDKIIEVCNLTPNIHHYLPTREYSVISDFIHKGGRIPKNLVIRLSAYMINGKAPTKLAKSLGVLTSRVSTKRYTCPAPDQDNKCGDCRECWYKNKTNITYKLH